MRTFIFPVSCTLAAPSHAPSYIHPARVCARSQVSRISSPSAQRAWGNCVFLQQAKGRLRAAAAAAPMGGTLGSTAFALPPCRKFPGRCVHALHVPRDECTGCYCMHLLHAEELGHAVSSSDIFLAFRTACCSINVAFRMVWHGILLPHQRFTMCDLDPMDMCLCGCKRTWWRCRLQFPIAGQ